MIPPRSATQQEAREIWAHLPSDAKGALLQLHREGRLSQAREWILAEAAKLPQTTFLDCAFALELAAERYLKQFPHNG